MAKPRTIIGVHGFNFDPKSEGGDPWKLYHEWEDMLGLQVDGFAWYSSTPTIGGIARALLHGYTNRYAHAYRSLAPDAARLLADKISAAKGPVSVVCHSLGSRVTLLALNLVEPGKVDRVLILDGAELQGAVKLPAWPVPPEILNVCVKHDRVLKDLGSWASGDAGVCIGWGGLGRTPLPPKWRDVFLDDEILQRKALEAYGWGLNAVDPLDLGGHWQSYRIQANWPLYRHFMRGTSIDKLFA